MLCFFLLSVVVLFFVICSTSWLNLCKEMRPYNKKRSKTPKTGKIIVIQYVVLFFIISQRVLVFCMFLLRCYYCTEQKSCKCWVSVMFVMTGGSTSVGRALRSRRYLARPRQMRFDDFIRGVKSVGVMIAAGPFGEDVCRHLVSQSGAGGSSSGHICRTSGNKWYQHVVHTNSFFLKN